MGQIETSLDKGKNPGNRSAFVDKAVNQIITAAESAMGEKLSCKCNTVLNHTQVVFCSM